MYAHNAHEQARARMHTDIHSYTKDQIVVKTPSSGIAFVHKRWRSSFDHLSAVRPLAASCFATVYTLMPFWSLANDVNRFWHKELYTGTTACNKDIQRSVYAISIWRDHFTLYTGMDGPLYLITIHRDCCMYVSRSIGRFIDWCTDLLIRWLTEWVGWW